METALNKICMVTPVLNVGGTEVSTLRLSKNLMGRGANVRWVSTGGPLRDEIAREGIPLIEGKIKGRSPVGFLEGVLSMRAIMKSHDFDIIHCQEVVPALMSWRAKKMARSDAKVIWHLRGVHEYTYPVMAKLARTHFDAIVANSHQQRNKLLIYQCPPEKVRVIHNAVEEPECAKSREETRRGLGLPDGAKIIGSIGRLVPMKGNRYLVEAFRELVRTHPDVHLLIVGDGAERPYLEERVRSLGLTGKVVFTGFRRDVADLMAIMDVFAFPTLNEAFGNVAVEAMYAGVPVVASYVGGIPEIVAHGETGWLVPPASKAEWVDALRAALDDRPQIERVTAKARETARRKFSLARMVDEVESLYRELVGIADGQERIACELC